MQLPSPPWCTGQETHPNSVPPSSWINLLQLLQIPKYCLGCTGWCKLLVHEVEAPGRVGDATIWNKSHLKTAPDDDKLSALERWTTLGSNMPVPSLITADFTFALSLTDQGWWSHTKRKTELVNKEFLITGCQELGELLKMPSVFSPPDLEFISQKAMHVHPKRVSTMVLSTLDLHKFLCAMKDQQYAGPRAVDRRGAQPWTCSWWKAK